jgi:hypothetical protein
MCNGPVRRADRSAGPALHTCDEHAPWEGRFRRFAEYDSSGRYVAAAATGLVLAIVWLIFSASVSAVNGLTT